MTAPMKWFVIFMPHLLVGCMAPHGTGKRMSGVEEESGRIVLTKEDGGRSLKIGKGALVEIRLDENPTTGYRWEEYDTDSDVVRLKGTTFVLPEKPLIGEGGTRIFTYEAHGAGQARIRLRHWQKWVGESSITEHFEVTVTVESSGS